MHSDRSRPHLHGRQWLRPSCHAADLIRLRTAQAKTFIFVTHSIEEAVYISDRIVLLSPRPGRVAQIIEPAIDRSGDPDAIRRDRRYLDTVEEIWQGLKQYVD